MVTVNLEVNVRGGYRKLYINDVQYDEKFGIRGGYDGTGTEDQYNGTYDRTVTTKSVSKNFIQSFIQASIDQNCYQT